MLTFSSNDFEQPVGIVIMHGIAIGAVDLRFDSTLGQIRHSVVNSSLLLCCDFSSKLCYPGSKPRRCNVTRCMLRRNTESIILTFYTYFQPKLCEMFLDDYHCGGSSVTNAWKVLNAAKNKWFVLLAKDKKEKESWLHEFIMEREKRKSEWEEWRIIFSCSFCLPYAMHWFQQHCFAMLSLMTPAGVKKVQVSPVHCYIFWKKYSNDRVDRTSSSAAVDSV